MAKARHSCLFVLIEQRCPRRAQRFFVRILKARDAHVDVDDSAH